jgi:predicted secreted protein
MAFSANAATFTYGTAVADVQAINSVSINKAEIDVTALGSVQHKTFLMGRHECTFSLTLHYGNASHSTLTTALLAGTSAAFTLNLVGGQFKNAAGGTAFVQSIDVQAQQDSSVTATVTFRVTGAVEFVAP